MRSVPALKIQIMSNNLTKNGTAEKDQEFFQSKQLQLSKYTGELQLGMAVVKQDQVFFQFKQLQLSQNTEELQLRMTVVMMMKLFLNHPILLIFLLIESQKLFLILFPMLFPILFPILVSMLVSILLPEQKRVRMKVLPLILLVLLLHFSESMP